MSDAARTSLPAMTVVNDEVLIQAISQRAMQRLVLVAPAVSVPVATVLAQKWRQLGREKVAIVLDLDPEVFRLGYGDLQAVQLLEHVAAELGDMIRRERGVRIGVLIADDLTLIYSPTPQLIEASPRPPHATKGGDLTANRPDIKPNAICLCQPPPALERDLGIGPDHVREQVIGLDKATCEDLAAAKQDLKRNPPQRFDIARQVRVFNALFEFVELELKGVLLDRRTVKLPAELMGLSQDDELERLLSTRVQLLGDATEISSQPLQKIRQWLVRTWLKPLPGYGHAILRTQKDDFIRYVGFLKEMVGGYRHELERVLQNVLDQRREQLVEYLLPKLRERPPEDLCRWLRRCPDDDELREHLSRELRRTIGHAWELINGMEVRLIFKAVTYESLIDPKFMAIARKAFPDLPELHEENDAALAQKPLEELLL